jgi:hypothetical protein
MQSYYSKLLCWCAAMALCVPLTSNNAHAHGGLAMAEDMCKLTVGPYMMHFSGFQPEASYSEQFCEDIPKTGHTVVVLDYIEKELRALPLEVRIIKDTGSEQDLQAVTVFHKPAQVYPTGSVDFEYTFDKPGKFIGLVTVSDKEQYVSRFPFSVGESKPIWRSLTSIYMVPVAAVLAVALVVFFTLSRRQSSSAATR